MIKYTSAVTFLILTFALYESRGGSLTPPGPPAPTMKTLSDVEPRRAIRRADIPLTISQPGSYYLAEPITLNFNADGISITTSGVTIDLNGFSLRGAGTTALFNTGITGSNITDIVIRNGEISDWPGSGISLFAERCLIHGVKSSNNNQFGIVIWTGTITDCIAELNGDAGFLHFGNPTTSGNIISGCTSSNNTGEGIRMNQPGIIKGNACRSNGVAGIAVNGPGCVVQNNYCVGNNGRGITVGANYPGCIVVGNTCHENSGAGIFVSSANCRIESNNATANTVGVQVTTASLVIKNSARGNFGSNYTIAANATFGPIVTMPTGGQITSTNPWANIEY